MVRMALVGFQLNPLNVGCRYQNLKEGLLTFDGKENIVRMDSYSGFNIV